MDAFQGMQRVLNLLGQGLPLCAAGCIGRIGVLQRASEKNPALLIEGSVQRIRWRWRVGKRFEQSRGGKVFVPLGVLSELLSGKDAGSVALWQNKSAQQNTLGLAGWVAG